MDTADGGRRQCNANGSAMVTPVRPQGRKRRGSHPPQQVRRERQAPDGTVQSLRYDKRVCETDTDSQTERTDLRRPGGTGLREVRSGRLGLAPVNVYNRTDK